MIKPFALLIFVLFVSVGHNAMDTKPQQFVEVVINFLRDHD